jgi:hypothetical protein
MQYTNPFPLEETQRTRSRHLDKHSQASNMIRHGEQPTPTPRLILPIKHMISNQMPASRGIER